MDISRQFDSPGVRPAWLSPTASLLTVAIGLVVIGMVLLDAGNSLLGPGYTSDDWF